jgi:hypothetical protein
MSVSGNWTLHFSWGCGNNYGQQALTFNANGTFGGTLPGKWLQQDGTLLLSFDGGPAKYGGTVDGNVGSGAMSTFAGLNGCWYLTKQGTVGLAPAAAAAEHKQSHDATGNKS